MEQLQRTPEWYSGRLEMFTSSELDDLLSEPKSKADKEAGKLSESSKDYVYDKVSEQITNGTILDYKELNNKEVKWGQQYEDEARMQYEPERVIKSICAASYAITNISAVPRMDW